MEIAINTIDQNQLNDKKVLVLYLDGCHESISGIIAGKLREKYCKPVIVFTNGANGLLKGSGRSIEAYDMFEKISEVKELLEKFGGHKQAAGLSIKKENFDMFSELLNNNCNLTEDDFIDKVIIDVPMPLSYVSIDLLKQMKLLEPFGNGNEKPLFAQKGVCISKAVVFGRKNNAVRLTIKDGPRSYEMVWFGNPEELKESFTVKLSETAQKDIFDERTDSNIPVNILYYPDINVYNGFESVQFRFIDLKAQ